MDIITVPYIGRIMYMTLAWCCWQIAIHFSWLGCCCLNSPGKHGIKQKEVGYSFLCNHQPWLPFCLYTTFQEAIFLNQWSPLFYLAHLCLSKLIFWWGVKPLMVNFWQCMSPDFFLTNAVFQGISLVLWWRFACSTASGSAATVTFEIWYSFNPCSLT